MREAQRVGDLALMQDLEFQHRAWMVQRAGWVLMALAVLAALLGLLGSGGPWSRASAACRERRRRRKWTTTASAASALPRPWSCAWRPTAHKLGKSAFG